MNDDIITRKPEQKDKDAILRLVTELNVHQNDPVEFFTPEIVERDVFGTDSPISTLVAEVNGEVVGYMFYHPAYDSGYAQRGLHVNDLHVTEKMRGQGVGKALMRAVTRIASEKGYTYLWWASKAWNEEAQAFYRKLGAIEEPIMAHALVDKAFKALLTD